MPLQRSSLAGHTRIEWREPRMMKWGRRRELRVGGWTVLADEILGVTNAHGFLNEKMCSVPYPREGFPINIYAPFFSIQLLSGTILRFTLLNLCCAECVLNIRRV